MVDKINVLFQRDFNQGGVEGREGGWVGRSYQNIDTGKTGLQFSWHSFSLHSHTMFGVIRAIPRGASRLPLTAKKGHNYYKGEPQLSIALACCPI